MNTLIKFRGEQTPAFLKTIKGKKVCTVTRHRYTKQFPIVGTKMPFVQWRGETEAEYFVATFYGGIVTLDINEREMFLGQQENVLIVAVAEGLEDLNVASKTKDQFNKKLQVNISYINGQYPSDIETITFKEIMKIVGWKFASRKVKENVFDFEED